MDARPGQASLWGNRLQARRRHVASSAKASIDVLAAL
jgi:hypothetical protein